MYTDNLSKDIKDDINTLKNLDIKIMPSQSFYKEVRVHAIPLYSTLVLISWLTMALFLNNAGEIFIDLIVTLIFVLIPGFFMFSKVAEYVFFTQSIKPHLKTGKLIDEKFRQFSGIFIGSYAVIQLIFVTLLSSIRLQYVGEKGMSIIAPFLIAIAITNWFVKMELTRTGIASLFYLVHSFSNNQDANMVK